MFFALKSELFVNKKKMDSSLNRAHQWSRKADSLTAAGKYEEAISCHNRAAENLLDTLQSPVLYDNPNLMSCLRQQHEYHLRQGKILQSKQMRSANMEARRKGSVIMRNKYTQTEGVSNKRGMEQENVLVNTQNIEESIREADTMLQFLKRRTDDPEYELSRDSSRPDKADDPAEAGSDKATLDKKAPKGDKVIIEELRILTGELHMHIRKLVQESGWLKSRNEQLKEELKNRKTAEDAEEELITMNSYFGPPREESAGLLPVPQSSSDSEDLSG